MTDKVPFHEQAEKLLLELGPPEAWQVATVRAIDAHLASDDIARVHWQAVLSHLRRIAPRPVPGDLDVYRNARLLIREKGTREAWEIAMEQAAVCKSDLAQQALSLRIADAIAMLSRNKQGQNVDGDSANQTFPAWFFPNALYGYTRGPITVQEPGL